MIVPERGWGERIVKRLAIAVDPHRSEWHAGRLLGGTLAAVCRKAGGQPTAEPAKARAGATNLSETLWGRSPACATGATSLEAHTGPARPSKQSGTHAGPAESGFVVQASSFDETRFEDLLHCPDCHAAMARGKDDVLACIRCAYRAPNEEEVYNLLPSVERQELYPGAREDTIDFSLPGHERQLVDGWYDVEGVFGNKYRWIGARASARLRRVKPGPQRLRIRGHAPPPAIPVEVRASVNGVRVGVWKLDRPGVFVLEGGIGEHERDEYLVEIEASPVWSVLSDDRTFTVNLSMIRLVNPED
jgi:hypothetical protein